MSAEKAIDFIQYIGLSGRNNLIKIELKEVLSELNRMLIAIQNNTINYLELLSWFTEDSSDQHFKYFLELVEKVEQSIKLYEQLANPKKYRLVHRAISHRSADFSNAGLVLSIVANNQSGKFRYDSGVEDYINKVVPPLKEVLNSIKYITNMLFKHTKTMPSSVQRIYIPTLRTARTLIDKDDNKVAALEDVMKYTTSFDYGLTDAGVEVNTGLSLFNAIDGKLNSDKADREEFKSFTRFLSETFFNGKEVEVVPSRKNTTILVAVDKEERELPHLGDGIQAIILLLYPLFIAPAGAWFFIEEPETHLHPGFQRLFINTIANHDVIKEKKLTIFLTTHSNHMLDFALDKAKRINLFTFRKSQIDNGRATYQVQLTAPHDLECLTALGVQNSSVFLSNCTIWVEGITDRIYLKAYLKAYLEHKRQTFSLLEGLHYSFLEYAGANVSHYTFGAKAQQVSITDEALREIQALSISNRIMLIADKDAGKDAKHERLTSQQHAGFEYIMLDTREIENLLTPEVIVGALKKLYPKLEFDANKLSQEKYHDNYLAKYLKGRFPELRDTFVAASGTISSAKKRQFAEAAAEVITSWDMLSDEAKELTEQVFEFIKGHNPRLGSN